VVLLTADARYFLALFGSSVAMKIAIPIVIMPMAAPVQSRARLPLLIGPLRPQNMYHRVLCLLKKISGKIAFFRQLPGANFSISARHSWSGGYVRRKTWKTVRIIQTSGAGSADSEFIGSARRALRRSGYCRQVRNPRWRLIACKIEFHDGNF